MNPKSPAATGLGERQERSADAVEPDSLTRQCAVAGLRSAGLALALIALAGGLYFSGWRPSRRSPARIAAVWHLSAAEAAASHGATSDRPPADGGWDGYRWAEAALLSLQLPVALWLLLLARDAARRRDALSAGMTLALFLVWLAAAVGGGGFAAR